MSAQKLFTAVMFLLLKADPELNFLQRFEVGFGSDYD